VGTYDVRLRFLPTSAVGGLTVSALAFAMLIFFRRRALRPLTRVACACVPLLAGVAIAATSPEPPLSTSSPDDDVHLRSLPDGSMPLRVRFEGGVTLEGASVTYAAAENRVRVELDWSRAAQVDRRLGVFVHAEPGDQKRLTGDHLRVSDSVLLEDLEVGELGRDIVTFDVPDAAHGKLWNIWVGLWQMRGDGSRMPVRDKGTVNVNEDRVLAGAVQVPP
jgi:hypothetical protein